MTVQLYLGSKCNLNCTYCHREKEQDKPLNEEFIKQYNGDSIVFKGGEPLIYMDTIKRIVELCPDSHFQITTNGKNIKEYLDYLTKNPFWIAISYDFDGGKERGYIPDFDLGIPLQLETVLYHGNTDLIKILDEGNKIKEKYKIPYIVHYTHPVHFTNERNELLELNKDDCDSLAEQFKYILNNNQGDRYHAMYGWLMSIWHRKFEFGETRCTNRHIVRATLDGQKYNCLYVRNQEQNSLEDNQKFIREHFPQCESCKWYSRCGSACIQSKGHDIECYFYKKLLGVVEEYVNERRQRNQSY